MHTCTATTIDQLLSVRDATPVEAYIVQHVNTCAACARELERLRRVQLALQALPALVAPPFAPQQQIQRGRQFRAGASVAIAASAAVIAVLIVFARHPQRIDDRSESQASVAATAVKPALALLVIRSQDLESRLRRMPSRPSVERASTTITIDSLQSRIQWVDYQLSLAIDANSNEHATQLWQDRIHLMDSLVKVRYAETQRFAILN